MKVVATKKVKQNNAHSNLINNNIFIITVYEDSEFRLSKKVTGKISNPRQSLDGNKEISFEGDRQKFNRAGDSLAEQADYLRFLDRLQKVQQLKWFSGVPAWAQLA